MPLIRRMPKKGFRGPRRRRAEAINVEVLNRFEDGSVVDLKALVARGIAKGRGDGLKVLGEGELTRRLEVVADAFSASAREKIEKAGGTAKITEKHEKLDVRGETG
jgi:large subunit ribosomal protein L15